MAESMTERGLRKIREARAAAGLTGRIRRFVMNYKPRTDVDRVPRLILFLIDGADKFPDCFFTWPEVAYVVDVSKATRLPRIGAKSVASMKSLATKARQIMRTSEEYGYRDIISEVGGGIRATHNQSDKLQSVEKGANRVLGAAERLKDLLNGLDVDAAEQEIPIERRSITEQQQFDLGHRLVNDQGRLFSRIEKQLSLPQHASASQAPKLTSAEAESAQASAKAANSARAKTRSGRPKSRKQRTSPSVRQQSSS